jgi:hypothetical protein
MTQVSMYFLLTTLYLIYLVVTLCIAFISCTCLVSTISVLNVAISPCCTNRCSEAKEDLEFFDMGFLVSDCPRPIACGLMVPFRCNTSKSVRLSLL